jgi:hypothetical protein
MGLGRWLTNQWDRTLAVVLALGGLLACLLGWFGISRSVLATQQIPYLASGGFLGLCLIGLGATLWLSADLRDEWRVLEEIREELAGGADESGAPERTVSGNEAEPVAVNGPEAPQRPRRRVLTSSDG